MQPIVQDFVKGVDLTGIPFPNAQDLNNSQYTLQPTYEKSGSNWINSYTDSVVSTDGISFSDSMIGQTIPDGDVILIQVMGTVVSTGATATAQITAKGSLKSITVTNAGACSITGAYDPTSSYFTVSISGGGQTAAAVAIAT